MKYFYDTEFLEGTQKSFFGQSKPTIDLISIGIVAEDGREYYAISKDFNLKEAWNRYDLKREQVSGDMRNQFPNGITKKIYWIRENVLKPIFINWMVGYNGEITRLNLPITLESSEFTYKNFKKWLKIKGKSNKQIAEEIKNFFLSEFEEDGIKMKFQKQDGDYNYYHCNSLISSFSITRHKDNDNLIPKIYGYYSAYDHVVLCWLFGKMIDLPKGFPMYTKDLKQILDEKPLVFKPTVIYNDGKYVGGIDPYYASWKEHVNYPKQTNEHNALADAKWNFELYKFIQTL